MRADPHDVSSRSRRERWVTTPGGGAGGRRGGRWRRATSWCSKPAEPVQPGGRAVGDRGTPGRQRRRHAAGGERRPHPADGEHLGHGSVAPAHPRRRGGVRRRATRRRARACGREATPCCSRTSARTAPHARRGRRRVPVPGNGGWCCHTLQGADEGHRTEGGQNGGHARAAHARTARRRRRGHHPAQREGERSVVGPARRAARRSPPSCAPTCPAPWWSPAASGSSRPAPTSPSSAGRTRPAAITGALPRHARRPRRDPDAS